MKMEGPKNGNNAPGRKRDRDFFPLKKNHFQPDCCFIPFSERVNSNRSYFDLGDPKL